MVVFFGITLSVSHRATYLQWPVDNWLDPWVSSRKRSTRARRRWLGSNWRIPRELYPCDTCAPIDPRRCAPFVGNFDFSLRIWSASTPRGRGGSRDFRGIRAFQNSRKYRFYWSILSCIACPRFNITDSNKALSLSKDRQTFLRFMNSTTTFYWVQYCKLFDQ